jgi:hypothetical protein
MFSPTAISLDWRIMTRQFPNSWAWNCESCPPASAETAYKARLWTTAVGRLSARFGGPQGLGRFL